MGKRGISAIVAAVLIILITIVAVTIIWVAIIPMIKDNLDVENEIVDLQIVTLEGYTVWDPDTRLVTVQVRQGSEEVDLGGISFIFSFNGISWAVSEDNFPGPNQKLVYHFNSSEFGKPDSVSIAPIFLDGRVGEISSTREFVRGMLVDNGEKWVTIDDTSDEEPSCNSETDEEFCLRLLKECGEINNNDNCGNSRSANCGSCDANYVCQNNLCEEIYPLTGLVSWWKFDGNANDEMNINNGIASGGIDLNYDALRGKVARFAEGVDDYVLIPNHASLNTENMSLSFWVKTTQTGSYSEWYRNPLLFNRDESGYSNDGLGVGLVNSKIEFVVGDDKLDSNADVSDGIWHHIILIKEGVNTFIYIDGVLDNSGSTTYEAYNSIIDLKIGKRLQTSYLDALLDDVRIYNRKLTDNEITKLYDYEKNIFLASSHKTDDEKLYLWESEDGINWNQRNGNPAYENPNLPHLFYGGYGGNSYQNVVRDPSIMYYNGRYYIIYTTNNKETGLYRGNTTGIAYSDDLINWEYLTDVPMGGVSNAWAPEWFIDDDNSVHVFVTLDTRTYEFHPITNPPISNEDFLSWSSPERIIGLGNDYELDAFVLKIDATYYLWYKGPSTPYHNIEYATSTSLITDYVIQESGPWTPWNDGIGNIEGASLVKLNATTWRIYFDDYLDGGIYYSESSDGFATWTPKQLTIPEGFIPAHPTIIRKHK
ncbi:MAG: hypothetical protein KKF50_01580 [Nanoarchaeota archaeon]|nr:hypothetical protein [Nanoarchaeota archaeon]